MDRIFIENLTVETVIGIFDWEREISGDEEAPHDGQYLASGGTGPLHTELWGDSFRMRDGYVLPPQAPGLGVRLNDEIKAKYPFVPGTGEFNSVPGKRMVNEAR